ncbi:MAG: 50S ribosomal protein L24 [Nitrososphaerota archaeon]
MSSKPSKVRRRLFEAPHHIISNLVRARLSDELRSKYGIKNVRVRKGDTVKILRGEYRGIEGKVTGVFVEDGRIAVEGVTREKIRGGTVPIKIHASKVLVTELNLDDKWRKEKIERSE